MPQVLRLQAEYECFPIFVDSENFDDSEYLDPSELPLSGDLVADILSWEKVFHDQINQKIGQNSGFKSEQERQDFHTRGLALARRLQAEMGSEYEVYYENQLVREVAAV